MSFFITLENRLRQEECFLYYFGHIEASGLNDYFRASATYWSRDQYYSNWLAAFEDRERLSRFVIITSMREPREGDYIEGWVFYIHGQDVFLQNHIFLMQSPLSEEPHWVNELPGPRETVDEDGEKLSEWTLNLSEVEAFFRTLLLT